MEFEIWHYWIIAAIVFFLIEIFIPSFLMASIGLGCILGFFASLLGGNMAMQLVLFIVGTTASFVGIKPVMKRYAYRQKALRTNASGLVGRMGKVIEEINEEKGTGCVAIDGDQWKSIPNKNNVIPLGEKVRVVSLNSIVLTVEPIGEIAQQQTPEAEIPEKKEKERFAIKLGSKTFFIGFNEISFLYSSNKISYIVTHEGKQFIHDLSLESLNAELPAEMFYRANRQFILTRNVVSEIKAAPNGKLTVLLKVSNGFPNNISVSRLKAASFREWMKTA